VVEGRQTDKITSLILTRSHMFCCFIALSGKGWMILLGSLTFFLFSLVVVVGQPPRDL